MLKCVCVCVFECLCICECVYLCVLLVCWVSVKLPWILFDYLPILKTLLHYLMIDGSPSTLPCPAQPSSPLITSNGFFDKGRVYVWWWFPSSQIYYPRVKGCLTKAHTNTPPLSTHVYLTALNYIVFFFLSSTFQPFQECLQAINSNHLMPQLHCCRRTLFVSFPWSPFEWRRFDGCCPRFQHSFVLESLDSIWNIVWKDNREHLHLFFFLLISYFISNYFDR